MVEVRWTASALQDLNDIGEYISKDSIKYAEITVNELFDSVDILENHPRAGVMVPEFNVDYLRQINRGNYRVVYQIINEFRIDILTVHNSARLISNTNFFKK
jgi:addiction module RelE/StbE family toxin